MPKLLLATGHAFCLSDLFYNFNNKKLKINCEECRQLIGTTHRDKLAQAIFKECLRIVLLDVIQNNVAFNLPTGAQKCEILMERVEGDTFKNLRRSGKWADVDFLKSWFSGYRLILRLGTRGRTPRTKPIYVTRAFRDLITEKTNTGLSLLASKDKNIKDYYEQMYETYPDVPKQDIQRICKFGFRQLYLLNSYGADVLMQDNNGFWCYIGRAHKDSIKYFKYYVRKLCIKLRVLYKRKKIPWDGYYYFSLSKSQYENYMSQKKSKGRPKKRFNYGTVIMYQILDECKVQQYCCPYIFRVPFPYYIRYKFFKSDFISDKAELIITREPLKFRDILVNENEYEFL